MSDAPKPVTTRAGMTLADGNSIPFDRTSTDPVHIVAHALARNEFWAEIRPHHLREARRVVKELKAAGLLVLRRRGGAGRSQT